MNTAVSDTLNVILSDLHKTLLYCITVNILSWIELKGICVRSLPGPVHLGLRIGHLCPMLCTKLEEHCSFSKVPDGPCT